MEIAQHYDEIARCNKCGFCQVACPIFRATGQEGGVARGRLALVRALIEGRMEWTRELEEPLFNCLLCGACTTNCFPAVATADLVLAARSDYQDQVGRGPAHRLLFDHLLSHPGRLKLAVRAVSLGKKSGLSGIVRALGMLRFLGHDFPKAEKIIDRFPAAALRDVIKPGVLEGKGHKLRIAYFVGCGMDLVCPQAAQASVGLLLELGRTVEVLDNCCCGLPAMTYGDRQAARKMAERNLRTMASGRFDVVVTDCSSCASFLKKYPELFAGDGATQLEAKEAASRVKDMVQALEMRSCAGTRLPERTRSLVVTYHDPCHARRGQKLVREPRELLKSLPDIEYREMPEADWCCGGAGSYALFHYDLSRKVLERKIDNVAKTGADVVVTSCPACIIHLSYGVRQRGLPTRVLHISEVVSGADEKTAPPQQAKIENLDTSANLLRR
jgi:glycolate oxidase iron-sulfur subunit